MQDRSLDLRHRPAAMAWTLVIVSALSPGLVGAADSPEPAPAPTPAPAPGVAPLDQARALLQARQWPAALDALRRVNATGDADWNNLMGFALRKQAVPDVAGAQRHYDAALRINPRHRGALEYSGELALMKNELPVAEARLASLAELCRSPCEELDDLKRAVARYKASGNRWQPGTY